MDTIVQDRRLPSEVVPEGGFQHRTGVGSAQRPPCNEFHQIFPKNPLTRDYAETAGAAARATSALCSSQLPFQPLSMAIRTAIALLAAPILR